MRDRLLIISSIVIVIGLLIGLNAVNYVQQTEPEESEVAANRSTYNAGPTGTRALFDVLNEAGYKVTRWRESPDSLLSQSRSRISTFVVVGRTQLPFEEAEARNLLLWVKQGGRLVLIDRKPDAKLLPPSGSWSIEIQILQYVLANVDPGNATEMTQDTKAIHPVQPTLLTQNVEAVKPSRFASNIELSYKKAKLVVSRLPDESPSPTPLNEETEAPANPAPVVHLGDSRGSTLVDYPHGAGSITVLSDPYIVANGGISLADNLQLAINILGGSKGVIAFDEFHQGRGATHNALGAYFAGTPVLAICGQVTLLILVIIWTRGRRFARPLPLPQIDRRSSLEFVASMAELQQRSRALDLAIENIYLRTRRVLTRYAGVDHLSSRTEIAARVALRSSLQREPLEALMRECEDTINGAAISERRSIELVKQLRELEGALGLRMRSREVKQAAEKI